MQQRDKPQIQFSTEDVNVLSKETVFKGFFQMVKYRFEHRLFKGGWSRPVDREMLERGHAAALLPYDPQSDDVVLIEQIRVGALEHAQPWQIEIVAGIVDKEESVEQLVRREAMEEAGVEVGQIAPITSYYPSAGGCSEKIDVFVGSVDATTAAGIHGLSSENEDIRVMVVSREQAYQMVLDGKIENGASIIALQWLQLNYLTLKKDWQGGSDGQTR
ncbi:ADP-ribose diphosphatase [Vibrio sp. ZSDZ34]|jgi:ADP-ribose pyrophosphatase|uniref:ADP-ribose pyrophosphatase n=1 Tax=Vibrio gelatinilyticus TaxID=2893468 RepID=A0A9X2AZQ1_9VIBR|nr:ADP-ribose diphosphatase [Vibrio gelatinilyticus]MCJ2378027.1 ADP-ribose diphosphatase [Vibrio gelatinilyticus]